MTRPSADSSEPETFILTAKDADISNFARNSARKSKILLGEINNNVGEERRTNPEDFVSGDGPYSVTQINRASLRNKETVPSAFQETQLVSNTFQNEEQFYSGIQEREQTMTFGDDDEYNIVRNDVSINIGDMEKEASRTLPNVPPLDLESSVNIKPAFVEETPRVDYDTTRSPHFDMPKPTPRIDYLDESFRYGPKASHATTTYDDVDSKEVAGFKVDGLDDIIALGGTNNQTSNASDLRPPSPPFDADKEVNRMSQFSESIGADERSPLDRLDNLARVPTPPPPPPPPPSLMTPYKSTRERPGTPPPGMIRKSEAIDIDDILNLGSGNDPTASELQSHQPSDSLSAAHDSNASADKSESVAGLPFMAELRRRQRSIDDDGSDANIALAPPGGLSKPSDSAPSPTTHRLASIQQSFQDEGLGLGDIKEDHRPSFVQFAQDPPQIIPATDYPESPINDASEQPTFGLSEGVESSTSSPPTPPPPPPPPPPPHGI